MLRRSVTVLAALFVFTVSGCADLLGGGSIEDEVLETLKVTARPGGSNIMPTSVECDESDALDYAEEFVDRAHSCNVTWVDGSSSMICVMEREGTGGPGWGTRQGTCEDLAASGWGRS